MNKIGTLQRRWSAEKPKVYDIESRTVCLDIQPEKGSEGSVDENGGQALVDGWSYMSVCLDRQIDYGHVKSQLIEAAFAQKDEFGLVMNALGCIIDMLEVLAEDNDAIHTMLAENDIASFVGFLEYRKMCADAAKIVVQAYQ